MVMNILINITVYLRKVNDCLCVWQLKGGGGGGGRRTAAIARMSYKISLRTSRNATQRNAPVCEWAKRAAVSELFWGKNRLNGPSTLKFIMLLQNAYSQWIACPSPTDCSLTVRRYRLKPIAFLYLYLNLLSKYLLLNIFIFGKWFRTGL